MIYALLALPVIAILLFSMINKPALQHIISGTISLLMLMIGVFLTVEVIHSGKIEYSFLNGLFYLDSLSIIVLDIVLMIGFMTSIYTIGYVNEEIKHGKFAKGSAKLYYILMYAFIFTIILVLTVENMGVMWIAIEATTLASAFLVGFNNDKHSLEAAWKYVIICSVGIAIALLGIIFLHLSSIRVLNSNQFLDWTMLYSHASTLNSSEVRLAFIFVMIGFGTKAGLVPMHTWLPDAHSQAPSPISALLSGVLLNGAMYGIIRTVAIVNRNLGSSLFTSRLMITFGLLSIITAAVFILTQKDYKRLLAYSSIEHMGIITVAVGIFTPLSVFGALFHMINHSLTKSMLFLSSGNILQKYNTKKISQVKGVLRLLPVSGTVFLLGLIAISGTPPFSIFTSEFTILASLFQSNKFLLGAVIIILLAAVFAGIALTLFRMFHGKNDETDEQPGETNIPGVISIVVILVLIIVSGVFIPDQIKNLITQAQQIVTGT